MGGVFSSPKPPAPPPLPKVEDIEKDLATDEREARLDDIKRRRRGRAGTIATSWTGSKLVPNSDAQSGKKLLGE